MFEPLARCTTQRGCVGVLAPALTEGTEVLRRAVGAAVGLARRLSG